MPFLIDGHNLIPHIRGLGLDDPDDEQKLIELLRAYLVRVDKKGVVIFDRGLPGGAGKWSNSVLDVRFAQLPKNADDLIRDRLAKERNPRGLVVVTADREIVAAAQQAGATVRRPAEFARQMVERPKTDQPKQAGLSSDEVAAWEEAFRSRKSPKIP
jgi:predicted RNA-binding protein with PIN domain